MPRRLITMRLSEYIERWYTHGYSHNAWVDSDRFITEIIERKKIIRSIYILYLSDESEITVDANYPIQVEQY